MNTAHTKTCSECNAQFSCGRSAEGNSCWCASLPNIVEIGLKDCWCKSCLIKQINKQIDQLLNDIDTGKTARPDFTRYQTSQLVEGIDFYMESGMYVFTKWYHIKRGYCCNSGCRHCPYRGNDV
ncbi:MAG: DUF5522 domain-containing protein [Cyclobacteriaceae bacterium]